MTKRYDKFGDKPKELQDACWENDPYLLPPDPEQDAKILRETFASLKADGLTADQVYKACPEKQAAYRAFLRDYSPELEAKREAERGAAVERVIFGGHKIRGLTPELAYPDYPEMRDSYQAFLNNFSHEDEAILERELFTRYKAREETPKQAFPNNPELRKKYSAFLKE
jgi:hypothetical protein